MDEGVLVERGKEKVEVFDDGGWEAKLLGGDIGKDIEEVGQSRGSWGQVNRVGRRGDVTQGCGIN
jgi:hypothetical protein